MTEALAELWAGVERLATADRPVSAPHRESPAHDNVDDWFFTPHVRPHARVRLFCLPYAGGMPWAFRSWSLGLPPDIEVCTLYLPGRGRRANERMPARFGSLVRMLRRALLPKLDCPYALFGHSFGALLAFELAAELQRAGDRLPEQVFVSASSAPLRSTMPDGLQHLTDAELLNVVRGWGGSIADALAVPEVVRLALAVLREDLRIATGHVASTAVLESPITAFCGLSDELAGAEAVAEWRGYTRAEFVMHGFAGGHFFIQEQRAALLAAMRQSLERV